jgi:hypothetical protein
MANLYEINRQILECVDSETGEIVNFELFEKLQLDKNTKIENIALWYKNLLSDAEQYKKEEESFKKRKEKTIQKAESLKKYLDSSLYGQTFKSAKVNVWFKKSKSVEIDEDFISWAKDNAINLITLKDPTVNKNEIKKAIEQGLNISHAKLIEKLNIQIK